MKLHVCADLDSLLKNMDTTNVVTVCAWCKRIKKDGNWIYEEPAENAMLTHGVCPECAVELRKQIRKGKVKALAYIGKLRAS